MNLPTYSLINFTPANIDDLERYLKDELNHRHPVAMNLLELGMDVQREAIGLIENYFESNNLSFRFPYPVYLISRHEPSITHMPLVKSALELPKFFSHKEGRMNVKESHVAGKNRLLQQEIKNTDAATHETERTIYARIHRQVWEQEEERVFCRDILAALVKGAKHG